MKWPVKKEMNELLSYTPGIWDVWVGGLVEAVDLGFAPVGLGFEAGPTPREEGLFRQGRVL